MSRAVSRLLLHSGTRSFWFGTIRRRSFALIVISILIWATALLFKKWFCLYLGWLLRWGGPDQTI
jgi:hypothetical protein